MDKTEKEYLPYMDETLSFEERAKDLTARMTLDEKVGQMLYQAPAIPRLNVPSYNWWNEALHGVARAGVATVLPQAIALAATFDELLVFNAADLISTEGRAKYHEFQRKGDHDIYKGLTFWSPNVNIFRDPRWGRGHETYGEDPWLTATLGKAFVQGLQGDDPVYLKSAACAKHFAVHSGPESERHSFNAEVSRKDLYETYLPAFEALVREAGVAGVMGAYNRTNGEPCCGSKTLLKEILRADWGFTGYVTSDCWALRDFHEFHMVTKNAVESAALAVNNTCDLNCGSLFGNLLLAVNQGLVKEETIDEAVTRLMTIRMRLGMFDDPKHVPFSDIPYETVDCDEHRAFSLEAAKRSLVLLKNKDRLLPLNKKKLKSIAVIGPNADSRAALMGNYHGTASQYVTVLEGIRAAVEPGTRVLYAEGGHLYKDRVESLAFADDRISEAVSAAERADVTVLCLGLDENIEGEEGDQSNAYAGGDKPDIYLPQAQQKLLKALCETGKPVILLLLDGSAMAINYAEEHARAIIQAFYPGAQGGQAIASMLFGEFSPSGRLPVTFYRTNEELPDFHDYSMDGRTYRYMKNDALYPFGYGLSYSLFVYSGLSLSSEELWQGESLLVTATVWNTGRLTARETVQLYLRDAEGSAELPRWSLRGVKVIELKPQEKKTVRFTLTPEDLAMVDDKGRRVVEPGEFQVFVGGSQPDERSLELTGTPVLSGRFTVTGEPMRIE